MATGSLTASATQLAVGGQLTLSIAVSNYSGSAAALSADNDPGDSSGWKSVALDSSGAATVQITPAKAGSYTFTLSLDGAAALDGAGKPATAGPITVSAAPKATTTAAPKATTTAAPKATTTAAPKAPPKATTTAAPKATTTAAPKATTTAASKATTTAAPKATTTAAAPKATTAPPTTTTAAPGTTTTAAPSGTTTAPPTSGTTVAPGTTTTAPASDKPSFADGSVTVTVDPDDGTVQNPNSFQVAADVKLTLKWSATNAASVNIDPGAMTGLPTEGTQDIPTQDAIFTLTAIGKAGTPSDPYTLEIHTHQPGTVVSPHVDLGAGVAAVLSFVASKGTTGEAITSAVVGETVTLTAVVSDATESVNINGKSVDLTELNNGQKQASTTVAIDGSSDGNFSCQALKGGAVAQEQAQHIDVLPEGDATGAGSGPGEGDATGSAEGTGAGSAEGTGAGSAVGTGAGSAEGTGAGSAEGTGAGSGDATGAGSAEGTGAGSAEGTGAGSGDATGAGSADGSGPDDSALTNPTWGAAVYTHGQPIELSVEADGVADGRIVYFVIENDEGTGNWKKMQEAQANVSSGKATVQITLADPDAGGGSGAGSGEGSDGSGDGSGPSDSDQGGHKCNFRFHASFTSSAGSGSGDGSNSGGTGSPP